MSYENPSQVSSSYWVNCIDHSIAATYPNHDGKWMMFFSMSEMDAKWNEACQLYRSGRLTGINSMKASTAKQNPMPTRLHGYDEGIIIFYCGPCEDKQNVMEYGRNILRHMHYSRPQFYYKSDLPHLINHSREYKHMYSLNTAQPSFDQRSSSVQSSFKYNAPTERSTPTYNDEPMPPSTYYMPDELGYSDFGYSSMPRSATALDFSYGPSYPSSYSHNNHFDLFSNFNHFGFDYGFNNPNFFY